MNSKEECTVFQAIKKRALGCWWQVSDRIKEFLFDTDTDPYEAMSTGSLWICTYVIAVDPVYISSNDRLSTLLSVAPLWIWTSVVGSGAVYQTVVLFAGGRRRALKIDPCKQRFWLR